MRIFWTRGDPGYLTVHGKKECPALFLSGECEWIEWAASREEYNWRNFHFVHLSVEDDRSLGRVNIELKLLGLSLRIEIFHTETEMIHDLRRRFKDMEELHDQGRSAEEIQDYLDEKYNEDQS